MPRLSCRKPVGEPVVISDGEDGNSITAELVESDAPDNPGVTLYIYEVASDGTRTLLESTFIRDGKDGRSAYEIWLYNGHEGTEQDFLEWLRGEDGKDGKDGEFALSSGSSGSSNNPRCTAAIATVGIPLLALSPLALAAQVNIPGLSPLVASAQAELQNFNTNLQQQSGIYDPNTANFMAQVNAELGKSGVNIGQVAGAAVLLTVGGLALKHVVDNCLPA